MVLIAIAGLAAALPLLANGGLLNTRAGGDSPFLLFRLYELLANVRAGVFPARWMPDAAYGLGYPFFSYYAALPYYLAAGFKLYGLSYIASLKAVQVLGFILAGLAMYGWAQRIVKVRAAALLAAVAYTFAPFHMVNVYVRGDSLSEFWAFVFYPLVLWAVLRAVERPSAGQAALLTLTYAGLLLTHNISALIFTPFAVVYALISLAPSPSPPEKGAGQRVRLLAATAGLLWGLALAAWFWLPALAEGSYAQLGVVTTGYFNYAEHFRSADLVQPDLLFNYDTGGPDTPFAMGLVQAALAAPGALLLFLRLVRRRANGQALFILIGLALSTLMVTPLSRPLWDRLPLLPFVQFPWRFLSVQALFTAAATGALVLPLAARPRLLTVAASGLALVLAASALLGLRPEFLPLSDADVTPEQLQLYEVFTGNIGTTVRAEYLPKWTVPRPYTSQEVIEGQPAPAKVVSGAATAGRLWQEPTAQAWRVQVEGDGAASLAFPTLYWPGWQATVDGQPVEPYPIENLGWIGVDVPPGEHEVRLWLGRTPLRAGAEALSVVALAPVLALVFRERKKIRWRPVLMAVFPLALVGLILHAIPVAAAPGDDVTLDFAQMAYPHHNPGGIDFGPAGRLLRYEYSTETLTAPATVTVTLHWSPGTQSNAVITAELVSPAEHLFGAAYTVASQSQPVGPTLVYSLTATSDVAPGVYFVRVRVAGPDGPLPARTPGGQPRGDLYLRPVRLRLAPSAADCEALEAGLHQQQLAPQTLRVRLVWCAPDSVPANYVVALRLRDPAGNEWAALDVQPAYGLYPTSAWQRRQSIPDRYDLALPEGTPPGDGYELEVKLYIAATLAPIYRATFNLSLPLATIQPDAPQMHRFNDDLALSRLQLPSQAQQGDIFPITAAWLALDRPQRDYSALWALRDSAGAAAHSESLPLAPGSTVSTWPAGAVVVGRTALKLPPTLPAGMYRLTLAITDGDTPPGEPIEVGQIEVTGRAREFVAPPMDVQRGDTFDGQIRLLGYDLRREGQSLRLRLYWSAITAIEGDYTLFVHLFDPATERIVAQSDARPQGGGYPTLQWAPGEVVADDITLSLADVPPGRYRLALGWYDAATGQRLPARAPDGTPRPADRVILAEGVDVP